MVDWSMFDALSEFFGDHYSTYKGYIQRIEDLKELKLQFCRMVRFRTTAPDEDLRGIGQSYLKLAQNLDTLNYGWNGDDMRVCWRKVLELKEDLYQTRRLKTEASKSVIAAIDEERKKWIDAAEREICNFNIFDKVTGAVDTTLQTAKEELERLIRSL